MNPAISQYITTINTRFQLGNATEHTFRGDLARLIPLDAISIALNSGFSTEILSILEKFHKEQ